MEKNTLLYGVIVDILGKPRRKNTHREQYGFDCPTCSAEKGVETDKKGNLEVNLNKGMYHCWSCGETHGTHGSVKKLIRVFGNKTHINKLKHLGIDVTEFKKKTKLEVKNVIEDIGLPDSFVSFSEGNPKSIEYKQAWNYLTKQRKLSEEIIFKHKMGYTTSGKYANRIILPSYDVNGELNYWVGRTYVDQKPKYLNPDSDKEEIIFNEGLINWDSTVYLVEGPFDHVVVYNSIPILGKKISDKLMNTLLNKSNKIVLLLDSDAWNDSKMLYGKLNVGRLHDKVSVVKLIDDYDIAKVYEDFGRDGVVDVMRNTLTIKDSVL